ncbi:MAG: hypothetical protein ACTSPV_12010, partial [Candidatus Hodarchaeales archaeon]
ATLDNYGPRDVKITEINDYSSSYIHLYNNSGVLTLYVSNRSSTDEKVALYISNNEPLNESGRSNAVGSLYFGESPSTSVYQYVLIYFINATLDNVENGTLTIWTYDRVNNNNSVQISIFGDLTPPTLSTGPFFEDYGSDYLHSNTTHFFFSNKMNIGQVLTISGTSDDHISGSGVYRVTYQAAFGSSPVATYGSTWSADYTIDSSDSEQNSNGTIEVIIFDNVNNSYSVLVPYVSDNTQPSGISILEIVEDLLPEYLHYVTNPKIILYYSNLYPERGKRKFTIKVYSEDFGGSGLRNASFPDIGTGFSPGGFDTNTTGYTMPSQNWNFSYTEDGSGDFNGTVTITVFDNCGNSGTVTFELYLDSTGPEGLKLESLDESSDFLYYHSASSVFYYSNTHTTPQPFTLIISAYDTQSGLFSANGSLDFNEDPSTTVYNAGFSLTYNVGQNETAGVDNQIIITVYDNVGNSADYYLSTVRDNDAPTSLTIEGITHSSEFLHYDSSTTTFYYSSDQSMSDSFTIQISASDNGAGLLNATGEDDFGDTGVGDTSYTTYYELTYVVDQNETASGDSIIITVYDQVGNNASIPLSCVLDNTSPTCSISDVVHVSKFLYYDNSTSTFYYSSDQSMSDSFTIQISASDNGAGLLNATGEDDFGETGVGDKSYTTYYGLTYVVDQNETASGDSIIITVYDQVRNSVNVTLNCNRDDTAPDIPILSLLVESSEYIYFNGTILYYSNDQVMNDPFTIRITSSDLGSGLKNATGSDDFGGETPFDDSYSKGYFDITYYISQSDDADTDDQIIITVYDRVGNSVQYFLPCEKDIYDPTINFERILENSSYLFYDGSKLYYSNINLGQFEEFSINVTCKDQESGLFSINGTLDFGETPSSTDYSKGYYLVNYTVEYGQTASEDSIVLSVYDRVGNVNYYTIDLSLDNTAPISVSFSKVDESSDFLYFDSIKEIFYYSNNQTMTEAFNITILAQDNVGGAGLFNLTGSTAFGETPSDSTYSSGYTISYTVSENETGGSSIIFYVYDNVGNVNSSVSLAVQLDNDAPSNPEITAVIENSEYLYYDNGTSTFYYSNGTVMNEIFFIRVTTSDALSGLQRAVGSSEFGGETPVDESYGSFFELNYTVSQDEGAGSDNETIITIFDYVGNSINIPLPCIVDNDAPSSPEIVAVIENSEYLYYNDGTSTFYYSNDQVMNEIFFIRVNASDALSGLQKAVGSSEFGGETPVNESYSSFFELNYTISEDETTSSNQIFVTIFDNVGNSIPVPLSVILDNESPSGVFLDSVIENSSHLYYDSDATRLFYSNDQTMSEIFNITILAQDNVGGAGLFNLTGSNAFGETPSDSTYSSGYTISYTVSENETSGSSIFFYVYDNVGNVNNSVSLAVQLDNDAPTITIDFPENKAWANTTGGVTSFGGLVSDNGGTYMSGISSTDFQYSNNSGTTKYSFENDLSSDSHWRDEDEIGVNAKISNANVTMIIYVKDRCGNENSASVEVWHDDTPPAIIYNRIISSPTNETLSAGGSSRYYNNSVETENATYFDIDFEISGGNSFYSNILRAWYQTDDGAGWVKIFENSSKTNYTTDWQIASWNTSLFNGGNTIDLKVEDEAGNILEHKYAAGVSGFIFNLDTQGPVFILIDADGNEVGISNPEIYDWNGANFNLTFSINSSSKINTIYIKSDQNPTEQAFDNSTDSLRWFEYSSSNPSYNFYNTTNWLTLFDIGGTGNCTIIIRAKNNAGLYSREVEFHLFVDEENPTLSLQTITELNFTWALHPVVDSGNGTLWYSNLMGASHAGFSVTVTATDPNAGSGMTGGHVDFLAFGNTAKQTSTLTAEFYVDNSPEPSDPWIKAYAIDASGRNSSVISLVKVQKDTTSPTIPSLIDVDVGTSDFLNFSTSILYYSNDQSMSDLFTIQLSSSDFESGLANSTGSSDFGAETPSDTSYTTMYELSYTVSQNETAGGDNQIIFTVYDLVGNSVTGTLSCVLDNTPPVSAKIISVEESSYFIYYDNSSTILYYSNDQSMSDSFTVTINASDSAAGLNKVVGSSDFDDETPSDLSYTNQFTVTYTISPTEDAGDDNQLIFSIFDNVGNSVNLTLACIVDNTAPANPTIEGILESSNYIYYNDSKLYYSNYNPMSDSFTIQINSSDSGSGILNVTGENDFGDSNVFDDSKVTYYELVYEIGQAETASEDKVDIVIFDKVGNSIAISLSCILDNTPPDIPVITDVVEFSEYLYYDRSNQYLYYSND